jgi:uncharacterized membrane protein YfcA
LPGSVLGVLVADSVSRPAQRLSGRLIQRLLAIALIVLGVRLVLSVVL